MGDADTLCVAPTAVRHSRTPGRFHRRRSHDVATSTSRVISQTFRTSRPVAATRTAKITTNGRSVGDDLVVDVTFIDVSRSRTRGTGRSAPEGRATRPHPKRAVTSSPARSARASGRRHHPAEGRSPMTDAGFPASAASASARARTPGATTWAVRKGSTTLRDFTMTRTTPGAEGSRRSLCTARRRRTHGAGRDQLGRTARRG